ncbi:MAG: DNA repair protein RecO, partial [Oscillospiraceae bacterium]
NIGENDKIITILSKEYGLIQASVKNAKTTKSGLAGICQVLSYNEFCLFKGKGNYIVNSAETVASFFSLCNDVVSFSLAGYLCELVCYICNDNDDNAEKYLSLLLNTLYFLKEKRRNSNLLKAIYELRLLSIAGFMPNLVCCSACAKYEDEFFYFLPQEGVIMCKDCFVKTEGQIYFEISNSVLIALRHIVFAEDNKIFSFNLTGQSLKRLNLITEYYVKIHTQAEFNSLQMYNALNEE